MRKNLYQPLKDEYIDDLLNKHPNADVIAPKSEHIPQAKSIANNGDVISIQGIDFESFFYPIQLLPNFLIHFCLVSQDLACQQHYQFAIE